MWRDLSTVNIVLALLTLQKQMVDFIVFFTEARVNKIFATLFFHGMQMNDTKDRCDCSHISDGTSPVGYKQLSHELPRSNCRYVYWHPEGWQYLFETGCTASGLHEEPGHQRTGLLSQNLSS